MNILLVDDDRDNLHVVNKFLLSLGHTVTMCASAQEALDAFYKQDFPLIISDIQMPGKSGIDLVREVSGSPHGWKTDCVLFTGYADLDSAVAAVKAGAYDYLMKPLSAEQLFVALQRVQEHQSLRRENKRLAENLADEVRNATLEKQEEIRELRVLLARSQGLSTVSCASKCMKNVFDLALKYHQDRDMPVLIEGETGTGKEIVARIIHYGNFKGSQVGLPFVDINCASFSPTLFESEFFGYEAGSFTGGAPKGSKGKLEAASGGTLFFDEIGELSLDLQSKLLRVLQEREFYRVGGLKKLKANVRVVCATNKNLRKEVEKGNFREDLYYRLNTGHIVVPPLRSRPDDIMPMARSFLLQFAKEKNKKFSAIDQHAGQMLMQYQWPGNVRELRNAMEWSVFMFDGQALLPEHLAFAHNQDTILPPPGDEVRSLLLALPENGLDFDTIKEQVIKKVLELNHGNKSATARYLNISRKAVNAYLDNGAPAMNKAVA